jgi:hypothetical protein
MLQYLTVQHQRIRARGGLLVGGANYGGGG